VVRAAVQGGPFAGFDVRTLCRRAHKMMEHLGLGQVELSLLLVDAARMRELNQRYRGADRPTDVLAFAMSEGEALAALADGLELLGDVVLCVPVAARQAARRGRSLTAELTTLLAHGLLHLLGHDHAEAPAARDMKRRTAELAMAARRRR